MIKQAQHNTAMPTIHRVILRMAQHIVKVIEENLETRLRDRICDAENCGQREGLKTCNGCYVAFYCSKQCQKKDWKGHKGVCCGKWSKSKELKELLKKL